MTTSIINHQTTVANWLALVNEAEGCSGRVLDEELESYLVFLLQRYVACTKFAESILALDFLHALNHRGVLREGELRDVGDKCLLFAGLFPQQAKRRRVSADYFVDLGQTAYDTLSVLLIDQNSLAKLYNLLCKNFLDIRDVLDCIRRLAGQESLLVDSVVERVDSGEIVFETNLADIIKVPH